MKKKILPQNHPDFTPQGLYALPKEKRKSAFYDLIPKNSSGEMTDYRLNALRKMRGDL